MIEIANNQWRLLSVDGVVFEALRKPNDNSDGMDKFQPLKTAGTAYVLFEEGSNKSKDMDLDNSPMTIDRVTGRFFEQDHAFDHSTNWSETKAMTGHCGPIQIKPNI